MPSTYTVNLGIEKPATGEQSGTWGDTTNVNFDIIDQAVNGSVRVTLTSAGTSGSPNDLNIVNGSTTSSEGRNKWIEIYSASDLGGSAYVRLVPNDAEKILFIRNSLAGSQSVLLFQGTYNASNDLEIPAGVDMVVKFDGAGTSATVTDVFTKLRATEITTPTLTAGTADINGGSVDGATVGAASASTGAFTTLTASTSLNIASSTTVDGVLDEDNMASDSATKLATQQSIKAYVDSQVGTVDTWAEVLANGATSGATNPEIDSGQALKTNTINETTAGSGVTIDSVLLKDDSVNAATLEVTTLKANDGTAAGSIADSTGVVTLNSVDINGGNIDGTTIGGTTTANGSFSTLTGATINATSVIDTPDIETARISARDGTTAINIADSTGAVDIDTSLNVDGTATVDGLTSDGGITIDESGTAIQVYNGDGLTQLGKFHGEATDGFVIEGKANNNLTFRTKANSAGEGLKFQNSSGDNIMFIEGTTNDVTFYDTSGNVSFYYDESVGTYINKNQDDRDFTVKSNNSASMLYVDGTNDRIGINQGTPGVTVTIDATENNFFDETATDGNVQLRSVSNTTTDGKNASILYQASDNAGSNNAFMELGLTQPSVTSHDSQMFVNLRQGNGNRTNAMKLNSSGDLILRDNATGSGQGPFLFLDRDSATPADDDYAGSVRYRAQNDADETTNLAEIYTRFTDVSDGAEDATLTTSVMVNGTMRSRIAHTPSETVINNNEQDLDFRVASNNNTNTLFMNAAQDSVSIGEASSDKRFNVYHDSDATTGVHIENLHSGTSARASITVRSDGGNLDIYATGSNYSGVSGWDDAGVLSTASALSNGLVLNAQTNGIQFQTSTTTRMHIKSGGEVELDGKAAFDTLSTDTSATTQTAVYSFSATTYTGAKLLVCVEDNTGSDKYLTEVLVTHDGSTAISTEYGQLATDTVLATFDVDISGGSVRLLATPASSNSMTFKVMSTQLLA